MRLPAARLLARAVLLALLGSPLAGIGLAGTAEAHGNMADPPSRNYRCNEVWKDDRDNPDLAKTDPMCALAWKTSPNAMWRWNGLLRNDLADQFEKNIPDGTLCSGGHADGATYDVLDTPGNWIATPKPRSFTMSLRDDSSHGVDYLRFYVTKPGFDPTRQKLRWSDLTLLKETGSMPGATHYEADLTVPDTTKGHQIVYTIWRASHLDQTYFFCSDVEFPGGGGDDPGPDPDPVERTCAVAVTSSPINSGDVVRAVVTHQGPRALKSWRVKFRVPKGVTVTAKGSTVTYVQNGRSVLATPSTAAGLKPGAKVTLAFIARGTGIAQPEAFRLNGRTCGTGA